MIDDVCKLDGGHARGARSAYEQKCADGTYYVVEFVFECHAGETAVIITLNQWGHVHMVRTIASGREIYVGSDEQGIATARLWARYADVEPILVDFGGRAIAFTALSLDRAEAHVGEELNVDRAWSLDGALSDDEVASLCIDSSAIDAYLAAQ
jgi:hypothetical protein